MNYVLVYHDHIVEHNFTICSTIYFDAAVTVCKVYQKKWKYILDGIVKNIKSWLYGNLLSLNKVEMIGKREGNIFPGDRHALSDFKHN